MATQTTAAKNKVVNLREHILNVPDLDCEDVEVPGWGVTLRVMALTGAERARFQKQILAQTPGAQPGQTLAINWERMWADLVILSARDPEDGTLIFDVTDRDKLLTKAANNLEVVAAVARRLSGLDDNAQANSKSTAED